MKLKYYLRGIGIGIVVTSLILYFSSTDKISMTDEEIISRAKELGMIENVTLAESSENKISEYDDLAVSSEGKTLLLASSESSNNISNNGILIDANDNIGKNNQEKDLQPVSNNNLTDVVVQEKEANDIADIDLDENNLDELTNKENNLNEEDNLNEDNLNEDNLNEDNLNEDSLSNDNDIKENDKLSGEAKMATITIIAGDSSYSAAKKLQTAGIVESAAKFDEYLCKNGYDKKLVIGDYQIPVDADEKTIAEIITKTKK